MRTYGTSKKDLTEREYEVLKYVMQGLTNREIAEKLTVTHHTVKAHVAAIIKKTGTKNRLDAAMKLISSGLVSLRQD